MLGEGGFVQWEKGFGDGGKELVERQRENG